MQRHMIKEFGAQHMGQQGFAGIPLVNQPGRQVRHDHPAVRILGILVFAADNLDDPDFGGHNVAHSVVRNASGTTIPPTTQPQYRLRLGRQGSVPCTRAQTSDAPQHEFPALNSSVPSYGYLCDGWQPASERSERRWPCQRRASPLRSDQNRNAAQNRASDSYLSRLIIPPPVVKIQQCSKEYFVLLIVFSCWMVQIRRLILLVI